MAAKKLSEKDVETLATFLVDRNERTVDLAKEHLKTILRANPGFRKILENAADPQVAHEARVFLEETRMADLFQAFQTLARQGQNLDLEHGAYLLAKLAFPSLAPEEVARPLNRMAEDFEEILDAEEAAPSQEVGFFRKYFFEEMGFRGNDKNYATIPTTVLSTGCWNAAREFPSRSLWFTSWSPRVSTCGPTASACPGISSSAMERNRGLFISIRITVAGCSRATTVLSWCASGEWLFRKRFSNRLRILKSWRA